MDQKIFEKVPELQIVLLLVHSINAEECNKEGIRELLSNEWRNVNTRLSGYENVQSHPRIKAWRETYQKLGIPIKKLTTSVENLVKRAAKVDSRIPEINPLVDFYNAVSVKYFIPFGGFDVDSGVCENLELRLSRTGDTFQALDADSPIAIPEGEACYTSGHTVVTRHVNWKQSSDGLINNTSKNVLFMAENVIPGILDEVCQFFMVQCKSLISRSCEMFIVDKTNTFYRKVYEN